MKRKIYWPFFAALFLLVLCLPFFLKSESGININRIDVLPGDLSTRLILETDSLLPVRDTYYSSDLPQTIVINLDKVNSFQQPQLPPGASDLVENLKFEKTGTQQARFLLQLKEKVPYRILSDANQTIIELNKIQKAQQNYIIDQETQTQLDKMAKTQIVLEKIEILENSDRVSVKANLSDKALTKVFVLEKPLRLVLDLFDTSCAVSAPVMTVNKGPLGKVRVAQFQADIPHPITRMVFDLKEPGGYTLDSKNNELVISFLKSHASPEPAVTAPKPTEPVPEAAKIEKLAPASTPSPLPAPNHAQETENKTSQAASQAQTQEDKFKPKVLTGEEEKYTGEIISLKFKDGDIRDIVLYLAEFANLNVVFDPDVRGVVTCDLRDVPWDQALDIILRNNKLGKVIEGNVLRIAPIGILTREDEEQRALRESKEMAGPLIVKTITLSYSKAKDVSALLSSKKSVRGIITIDDRTNTLIIEDVKDKLELLEKLISVLDTPTPQVSIEARIVEATSTFIRNLGIQWGYKGIADPFYGNATSLKFPNKILADGNLIPVGEVTKGISGPLGGYGINLPAPAFNTAIGFSFANVLDTFRLDVALSALETEGNGRIISSPKVTTQNNQPAEIIQGRQIPVQTVANFTVTTRYVNAALELRTTPQITAEGTIIMTVEIQNNAADFSNLVQGIPPITTQSAKTTVMIPDGGTTVIGGIYRTEDSVTRDRVPFLHKIPIIGNLFRSFARTKQNRELLIFITPRIIK
jgi:type IV pilus assembly protein PilQ